MKKIILVILCTIPSLRLLAQDNRPLFVIDGKQVMTGNTYPFPIIRTEDIANITVVKSQDALIKYGNAGCSGVVEITLKKGVELISYDQLLDSFHINPADKVLPAFMDKYYIRDKQHCYTLEKLIKSVSLIDSGSQRFIRISTIETSFLYIRGKNYYLVNGIKIDADCITFIDPVAVRCVTYLKTDDARKIYGKDLWSNILIYLDKESDLESLSYFYEKFHIPTGARNWPLFYAGTDRELSTDAFFAMPSMVKEMRANTKEMRVDVFSNVQPAQTKMLEQKIQKIKMKGEANIQIRSICMIGRQTLLQQYAKNDCY